MSFRITCPNCGPRDVSEFRYGGELVRAAGNLPQAQQERWHHRFGCGRWLVARRDVRTNVVMETALLTSASVAAPTTGDAT